MSGGVTAALLVLGSGFMLVAGLAMLRMPDLFTRMSANTKAATLGGGLLLIAVTVHFAEVSVGLRALVTVLFIFLTSPVAAHMIGRAAYFVGVPLWKGTLVDELRGRYDPHTHVLRSGLEVPGEAGGQGDGQESNPQRGQGS